MNLFRVGGIPLALHFSFLLLVAANAFAGWWDGGYGGLFWDSALLLAAFTCVVLHELGHCFAARRYGIGVRRILLLPIGGMAEFDAIPREPRRELMITFAGPAVNFVIAGLLWLALPSGEFTPAETMSLGEFGHLLMQWNLVMGIFNFLPAFPMDGGRILRALLATRLDYLTATRWAATTGKTLCVVGIAAAAYYQPFLIILPVFIFVVGELEYRAVKRREQDDARWRAMALGFDAGDDPLTTPPVLTR